MHNTSSVKSLSPLPPWTPYAAVFCLLFAYGVVPLVVVGGLQLFWPQVTQSSVFLLEQILPGLVWVGIFVVFYLRYQPDSRQYMTGWLGLRIPQDLSTFLRQTVALVLMLAAVITFFSLLTAAGKIQPANPYAEASAAQITVLSRIALWVAPVLEEVVFRGFLQGTLYKAFSPFRAILVTALVFTVFHGTYGNIFLAQAYVFAIGLLLGYFRHKTGSVYPGMVAHLANNLLASAVMLRP